MLKKANRMRLNKDFDRAFKLGQSFYGKNIGLRVVSNDLKDTRFGILISTKISKKANIRNKLRRQIKAVLNEDLKLVAGGKDVVIIVFSQILNKKFEEIAFYVRESLNRLGLYKK